MNNKLRFIEVVPKSQRLKLCLLIISMFASSILDMVSLSSLAVYISFLVDEIALQGFFIKYGLEEYVAFISNDNIIIKISLGIVIIFFAKNLFIFFVNYQEINFLKNLRVDKTQELFKKYISIEYKEFISKNFSYYQRIILNEVNFVISTLQQIFNLMRETMIVIGVLIIFSIINIELTIYVFCFFIIICLCYYFFFKKKLKYFGKVSLDHRLKKQRILNEFGSFFKDIKIYDLKTIFIKFFFKELDGDEKYRAYGDIINRSPRLIFEVICVILIVAFLIFFEINNYEKQIYLPIVSFFGIGLVRILPSFNIIAQVLSKIKINQAANSLVLDELKKNQSLSNVSALIEPAFEDFIEFKNVSFSYGGSKILNNFNYRFRKNSIIGIFGKSGSGKTTILNLLSGLLKPQKGEILCDGININKFGNSWNKLISFMGQDTFILNDSLKRNITLNFDENISDNFDLLKTILIDLNLSKKEKINENLSKIFENSESLSGGEKQRIGIARAIYKNSSILLLDEPTNNLDIINEKIIFDKILSLKQSKTIIIVTHNLNLKKICDTIIEYDESF